MHIIICFLSVKCLKINSQKQNKVSSLSPYFQYTFPRIPQVSSLARSKGNSPHSLFIQSICYLLFLDFNILSNKSSLAVAQILKGDSWSFSLHIFNQRLEKTCVRSAVIGIITFTFSKFCSLSPLVHFEWKFCQTSSQAYLTNRSRSFKYLQSCKCWICYLLSISPVTQSTSAALPFKNHCYIHYTLHCHRFKS